MTKIIQKEWEKFNTMVGSDDDSAIHKTEMRYTFHAGALSLLACMARTTETCDPVTKEVITLLLEQFKEEFQALQKEASSAFPGWR